MPLDMNDVLNGTETIETILDTTVVPHHSEAVKLLERRWRAYVAAKLQHLTTCTANV